MSYGKIVLATVAINQDLLSEMKLVLFFKELILFGQYIIRTMTTDYATDRTHTPHCMQGNPKYNEAVVYMTVHIP